MQPLLHLLLPSNWQVGINKKAGSSCLFIVYTGFLLYFLQLQYRFMNKCHSLYVLLAGLAFASTSVAAQPKFQVIPLTAGMYVIQAEVAVKEEERQQGLMFREKMGPNEGMVFLFDAPASVCMWMKNTLLPLSVAFIDESGKIINIEDMKPQTTDSHCTKKPARYALEMNQGWFKQKNIKPGTMIKGLPQTK